MGCRVTSCHTIRPLPGRTGETDTMSNHTEPKHTPTPWGAVCLTPRAGYTAAEVDHDRARIVRAVNAHDALREALAGILEWYRALPYPGECPDFEELAARLREARAALALCDEPKHTPAPTRSEYFCGVEVKRPHIHNQHLLQTQIAALRDALAELLAEVDDHNYGQHYTRIRPESAIQQARAALALCEERVRAGVAYSHEGDPRCRCSDGREAQRDVSEPCVGMEVGR